MPLRERTARRRSRASGDPNSAISALSDVTGLLVATGRFHPRAMALRRGQPQSGTVGLRRCLCERLRSRKQRPPIEGFAASRSPVRNSCRFRVRRQPTGVTVMPVNDDWKEHLGFISGTVLVWALILMKLLPIAAGMQLPNGIHYVDPHGSADIDLLVFSLLTVSAALGITGIILGVFHIVARGLWFATAVDNSKQGSAPALDNFCRKTFVSVFVVAKIAIIILLPGYPLFFVVIGLQRGLHRLLSVDSFGVGMGLYMFVQTVVFVTVFVTVMLVFAFWQRRAAGGRTAESGPARLSAFYGRIRDGM